MKEIIKNTNKLEWLCLIGMILTFVPIIILFLIFMVSLSYIAFQQSVLGGILVTSIQIGGVLIIIYSFLSDK